MKLVDILARDLKVWPDGLERLSQLKGAGYIINGKGFDGRAFDAVEIADETHIAGAIVTRAQWQAAVDALNAPKVCAWNGEGLPPVGTVCELRAHKLTDWSMAKIEFAFRNVIVWDWIGEPSMNGLCTAYAHNVEFRPIRTSEQIAAEERKAAVTEMFDIFHNSPGLSAHEGLMAVYDAGYRKQVNP